MARRCFYSFHFKQDNWRAATVRGIGSIEGNEPVSDNDWESITAGSDGDRKIEAWIADQMQGRSCTILLVGEQTANRKWINYEICKSWNDGLGIVGIRIHGLKNSQEYVSNPGGNPFDHIDHNPTKQKLSAIVKCYDPAGTTSRERYDWISRYLSDAVEEAVGIRAKY